MSNLKVGTPVYHYMQMNKVGVIIAFEKVALQNMQYTTQGVQSTALKARVQYNNGEEVLHDLANLMRADLD